MFMGKRAYFAKASLARQNANVIREKVLNCQKRPGLPALGIGKIDKSKKIVTNNKFSTLGIVRHEIIIN